MLLNRRRRGRLVAAGLVVSAIVVVSCIDMSAPSGAASISQVKLPSPSVVRGDTMRDSTGAVAPVAVIPYSADGLPIPGLAADLFILDTTHAAHFAPNNLLVGDKLGIVGVIGQIGALQTQAVPVQVTVRPTKLVHGTAPDTARGRPLSTDSATSVGHSTLSVTVRGVGDTAVAGIVVRFRITKSLGSSSTTTPAVFISDVSGKVMTADTTDASGTASKRQLSVLTRLLSDQALLSGQKVDSVIVEATASYKGSPLAGSPLTLVIPVKPTLP